MMWVYVFAMQLPGRIQLTVSEDWDLPVFYKIGVTTDPVTRYLTSKTYCPGALSVVAILPGDASREKTLHSLFHNYRLSGEWFYGCVTELHDTLDLLSADVAIGRETFPDMQWADPNCPHVDQLVDATDYIPTRRPV